MPLSADDLSAHDLGIELTEVEVEKGFCRNGDPVPVAAVRVLWPGTASHLCGQIGLGDVVETVDG